MMTFGTHVYTNTQRFQLRIKKEETEYNKRQLR